MLCDRCQKKDAKILYTEIINGVKKEQHLCEECAGDYTSFQMEKPILNSEMTLGDLLSTLLDNYYTTGEKKESGDRKPDIKCSSCNTTYEELLQKGRFGCAECYKSFKIQLSKTFKGIQGSDIHSGKRPRGYVSSTDRIIKDITETERLSIMLQEAIEKEEFEEAASLRDLIKQMKEEETNNA